MVLFYNKMWLIITSGSSHSMVHIAANLLMRLSLWDPSSSVRGREYGKLGPHHVVGSSSGWCSITGFGLLFA